jgi:uncharacterized membrane protein YdjX (TVP38/TMEM64 family)
MSSKTYQQIRRLFPILTIIILAALIVAIIFWPSLKDVRNLSKIAAQIQNLKNNPLAPVIFIFFYMLVVVLALPSYLLTFAAGPLFGIWWGSLWAIIGTNLGCQITFLISRFLGRNYVERFLKSNRLSERIFRQTGSNGFLILFFLRLVPGIPFPVINYLAGLTLIRQRDYTSATFLGTLPGTFLYVYLAANAVNIKKNPLGIVVPLALIILFAVCTVIIGHRHKIFSAEHSPPDT